MSGNFRYDIAPVDSGELDGGANWRLYATAEEPIEELVSAAFCFGYDAQTHDVMLMQALRNGKPEWGMTGGHVGDPPFEAETPREAAAREGYEEGGFRLDPNDLELFAVRQIDQPTDLPSTSSDAQRTYRPRMFVSYYSGMIAEALEEATGPEVLDNGYFSQDKAEALDIFDKKVIRLGFARIAANRDIERKSY